MSQHSVIDNWQFRLLSVSQGSNTTGLVAPNSIELQVGSGLRCHRLTDADGLALGYVLGLPIDLDRRDIPAGDMRVNLRRGAFRDTDSFAAEILRRIRGRHVWICEDPTGLRLYPHSGAQVPCVWDNVTKSAGSTAYALFDNDTYEQHFDARRFARFAVDKSGWFPAGLTARAGFERLLPNHHVDLETWTAHSQPMQIDIGVSDEAETVIEETVELLRSQSDALTSCGVSVAQGLTPGRDTRLLLAIAKRYRRDIDFVTVAGPDQHALDTIAAQRFARRCGLRHKLLAKVRASTQARQRYMQRGGHVIADANATYHPSIKPLAETHVFVGGAG